MLNRIKNNLSMQRKTLVHIILGTMIMAFTLINIHAQSKITEGGVLGLTLFAKNVLNLDPSIVSFVADSILLLFGLMIFGKSFATKTIFTSSIFAIMYKIMYIIGPIIPSLYNYPLISAILGGIGIGIGCGLIISKGIACGGDDSLALILSKKLAIDISIAYLSTDAIILLLSLVYIPFTRIIFSFITTIVSSLILDQFSIDIKTKVEKQKESVLKKEPIFNSNTNNI